jgi:uncharacterized membrane protein
MLSKLSKDPVIRLLVIVWAALYVVNVVIGSSNASGFKHYPSYFSPVILFILVCYILVWPFLQKSLRNTTNRNVRTAKYSLALVGAILIVAIILIALISLAFGYVSRG